MLFALPNLRVHRPRVLGAVVIGTIVAGTVVATHPAAYAAALATVQSAVSCATTSACVSGSNTSSGPGVSGTSSSGYGVYGVSKSNDGVKAVSTSSNGVSASSTSAYGLKGESSSSYGVYGFSASGPAAIIGTSTSYPVGVVGTSTGGDGVDGTTTATGYSGVSGNSSHGVGVLGQSFYGTGLEGISYADSGQAIYGTASGAADAVDGYSGSGNGLYGNSVSGYGVQAHTSSGPRALFAVNDSGDGSDITGTYIGMIGRAPASGGYPLLLTDSNGNNLFFVDGAGDVAYSGSMQSFSRTSGGGTVQSYSAKTTEPVVEDSGSAQLSAGTASVVLDPTFATSIDMRTPYKVFITPDGDTHGLFVALKTAHGFIVRESQGGHSSVAFDYRILASAQGQAGKRMAPVSSASFPRAPIMALKRSAAPATPSSLLKK